MSEQQTVYVLEEWVGPDSNVILGVYTTLDAAERSIPNVTWREGAFPKEDGVRFVSGSRDRDLIITPKALNAPPTK